MHFIIITQQTSILSGAARLHETQSTSSLRCAVEGALVIEVRALTWSAPSTAQRDLGLSFSIGLGALLPSGCLLFVERGQQDRESVDQAL